MAGSSLWGKDCPSTLSLRMQDQCFSSWCPLPCGMSPPDNRPSLYCLAADAKLLQMQTGHYCATLQQGC